MSAVQFKVFADMSEQEKRQVRMYGCTEEQMKPASTIYSSAV